MSEAADSELRAAVTASLREGVPLAPEFTERLGRPALLAIFRALLDDDPTTGHDRLGAIVSKQGGAPAEVAAEALGKFGGPEAGPILAAAAERATVKAVKKSLRRALHFFEARHGRAAAPTRTKERETIEQAWLSSPGAFGARLWLARRGVAEQTPRLATISVSDFTGVRDFHWSDGSVAAVQAFRSKLAGRGIGMVEVPWSHLRARIARLERITETLPPNYEAFLKWLGPVAEAPAPHPALPDASVLEVERPPAPEAVRALLVMPETGDWLLPPEAFEGKLNELRDVEQSSLVVDGLDPKQRVDRILREVLDRYLEGEEAARWRDRLLDLAHVLAHTGRRDAARVAAFLAMDLDHAERSPIADSFLWSLGSRALSVLRGGPGGDESEGDDEPPEPPPAPGAGPASGLIIE